MQNQVVAALLSLLFLQATAQQSPDIGAWVAPVIAAIATVVTVYGQVRQKRLENEIGAARLRNETQTELMNSWKILFEQRGGELQDIRQRLRGAEAHTRVCERGQMKLVAQLMKAGVEIDFDRILDGLSEFDKILMDAEVEQLNQDNAPHLSTS